MTKRSAVLAAAAAAIFVTGGATSAAAEGNHEGGEMVHCDGVNGCKGQSGCATDHSACKGQNECAGKGWVEMTPAECEAAQAAKGDE